MTITILKNTIFRKGEKIFFTEMENGKKYKAIIIEIQKNMYFKASRI